MASLTRINYSSQRPSSNRFEDEITSPEPKTKKLDSVMNLTNLSSVKLMESRVNEQGKKVRILRIKKVRQDSSSNLEPTSFTSPQKSRKMDFNDNASSYFKSQQRPHAGSALQQSRLNQSMD